MTREVGSTSGPRLAQFIQNHIEPILAEWETFARSIPSGATMSVHDLRDHARDVLLAVAKDMETAQTEAERDTKAKGYASPISDATTAAFEHGAVRQLHGFDLNQVVSEYRALRASVLRLFKEQPVEVNTRAMEDIARFNEGIDQALTESVDAFSAKIAESRETFMAVLGHDLRAPLGVMNTCLLLLHKPNTPALSCERIFHFGARSIAHMDGLITVLLEYARTRLGRGIDVDAKPDDLGALCRRHSKECAWQTLTTTSCTRAPAI